MMRWCGMAMLLGCLLTTRPAFGQRDLFRDWYGWQLMAADVAAGALVLAPIDDDVRGVLVTSVRNVSAAGEANILEGDVIQEVQGQRVTSVEQFRRIIDAARSGQKIRMYVTTPARRTGGDAFTRFTILTVP